MDDFSRTDSVRAALSPLCCFPTCRLAPPIHLSDAENDDDEPREWYEQSRPSGFVPIPGNWEDADSRRERREADLLSLHEGLLGSESDAGTAERRARRVRGGDISGSGAVLGSGLSRWTLLRSWWKGTGRVVLTPEDEGDDDPGGDLTDDEEGDITREEELPVVRKQDEVYKAPPTVSSASGTHSDVVTTNDDASYDLEREARRIERRARRDARTAGLSTPLVDEFDPPPPSFPSRRSYGSQASSSKSRDRDGVDVDSAAAQSHGFDFNEQPQQGQYQDWVAADEGYEEAEVRREERRRRRRERRENGEEGASSRGSQSANGDPETDIGGSSNGSLSSRRGKVPNTASTHSHLLSPTLVPLPSSPAERPRHRQYPSVSSNSNSVTSSSSRPRRPKTYSPLAPASESFEVSQDPISYFTDENGQMQPYPSGQWVLDDAGQPFYLPHDPSLQTYDHIAPNAYDHIAPLPSLSTIDEPPIIVREPTPPQSKIVPVSSDPTSFLQALQSTKLPSPLPSPPPPAPVVVSKVEEGKLTDEEEIASPWGGIVERKGNGWEAGEGALESVWRDRALGDSGDEEDSD
jgi:hypothetical protein